MGRYRAPHIKLPHVTWGEVRRFGATIENKVIKPFERQVIRPIEKEVIIPIEKKVIQPLYQDIIKPVVQTAVSIPTKVIDEFDQTRKDITHILTSPSIFLLGGVAIVVLLSLRK